jgi:hypothetical protein
VAWTLPGANLYTIWQVDSGGNYLRNLIGGVSGSDIQLEGLEQTFNQDLNGDGTIGWVDTVIESSGSTKLVERGNVYTAVDSTGTGRFLTYGGNMVTDGEFGAWKPLGVEAVPGGFVMAWTLPGTNLFTIWQLDDQARYTGSQAMKGSDTQLERYEQTFQQDLNGDGTIGVPSGSASQGMALFVGAMSSTLVPPPVDPSAPIVPAATNGENPLTKPST